jgi:hypothetical protein
LPPEFSHHKHSKPGRFFSKPGFLLPAVQALAIQVVSAIVLYLLLQVAWIIYQVQLSLAVAALLQGAIAALLSYWRRLPAWWLLIQLAFPITLLLAYALQIPPGYFLAAFIVLLLVYWTPFKTRVPLYLSGPELWETVGGLLPKDQPTNFLDIGSGLGGLVLHLAKRYPNGNFYGIELAPFPWFVSWLRGRLTCSQAHFTLGNYNKSDFSQFDLVFAYLSPAAMNSLWEKASVEMRPGSLLLSYEFHILDVKPDIVIQSEMDGSMLYGWRISYISHK